MAGDLLRFYRDFILSAPDEVCGGVAFITAPPEEFVPEPVRGQPVIGVVVLYVGDPAEGEEAFGPLREFGPPGLDMVQPMPYVAVQQLIDPANPRGRMNYWNADFYAELPDDAVDVFVERDRHIAWTREFSGAMKPWATGRAYINFLGDEGLQRVEAAYGPEKFARLQALKDNWGPTNLFRHNMTAGFVTCDNASTSRLSSQNT
jgi:Berberine and berberine like